MQRPIFEAQVIFNATSQSRRTNVLNLDHPTARYRPHVSVKDPAIAAPTSEDRLAVQFPQQAVDVEPGKPVDVQFEPLFPTVDYSALKPGVTFVVLEGPNVVARGRVTGIREKPDDPIA